jgi:hypothetical protein
MRVLDLSSAGSLTVRIGAAAEEGSGTSVTGPLLAAAWATRLGSATHLLVSAPPSIERGTAFLRATQHFAPGAIEAYEASYRDALARCAALTGDVNLTRARFQQAFDEAMARYQESRRRPFDFSADEAPAAREEFSMRQMQITLPGECRSLPEPQALRALEGAELPPTSREVVRVRWDVRIIEVPGGRVVWAARFSREGADRTAVLDAMINSLLEALPWAARAPSRAGTRRR